MPLIYKTRISKISLYYFKIETQDNIFLKLE